MVGTVRHTRCSVGDFLYLLEELMLPHASRHESDRRSLCCLGVSQHVREQRIERLLIRFVLCKSAIDRAVFKLKDCLDHVVSMHNASLSDVHLKSEDPHTGLNSNLRLAQRAQRSPKE